MVIHENFADFLLFLYVHMSHADGAYDPNELATIKAKMGRLYPDGVDLERKLYGALRQYNNYDKGNVPALVQASVDHFKNQASGTDKLYTDLHEIIQADGKLLESETYSLENLKKIIDRQVSSNG